MQESSVSVLVNSIMIVFIFLTVLLGASICSFMVVEYFSSHTVKFYTVQVKVFRVK